ncbi:unnamed protein product [Callosobruchus maculatus]|uniref:Serine protease HTRA2, mitochondrial n=1 Tax=Callosobruchus maculatus TaxID=64391 RepID=A0A653BGL6_CALMS|nr:unnamed protein product [Callosobruchus maculatus]
MSYLKKILAPKSFLRAVSNIHKGFRATDKYSDLLPALVLRNVNHSRSRTLRYLLVFTSGLISYKIYHEHFSIIPGVSAFTGQKLAGRRKQYNFIADVVETSAPAVVYIEIKDARRTDFFTGRPITISNGSGFIIQENGLILTNAHVVTNKPHARVEVKLIDGRVFTGIVEDIDLKSDLATVRIPAKNLPVMKLGNSADLKPGEFVVAIGSPLALSNTVTSGVVSSTHRASAELGLTGKDMVYIQTDAAITFGNSGGPLVNLDGEAIGVNSMKVTAGISFAIPIDYVKAFLEETVSHKKPGDKPKRLYMGITMLTLTPQIIHELQQRNHEIPRDIQGGVLVWKVIYGSPAHSGGIQPGDIVTHIDGKPVRDSNDVYNILTNMQTKKINLTISRYGRKVDITVEPEDIN